MTDEQTLLAFKEMLNQSLEVLSADFDKKLDAQSANFDQKLEQSSKELFEQFCAVIEDKVSHEINVIAEGHRDILKRLPEAEEVHDLKSRVTILERVVKDHTQSIKALSKAQ